MALSAFRKKKIESVYQNLYDSNKDGVIDKNDFSDCIEKISKLHHWATNGDAYKLAKEILEEVWDGLKIDADINQDGIVTREEWVKMWSKFAAANKNPDWNEKYIKFMFLANDTSGDDLVDKGEFVTVQTLFGNSEADSKNAFDKLSAGTPNNMLSFDDFKNLWHEYFSSDDPKAKGNYLFGQPPQ